MRWEKVEVKPIGKEGDGGPGKRWGHTCNSINGGRHIYVFGGYGKDNCQTNQVHVFDTGVCVFLFLSLFTLFLIFCCFDLALLLALSYFLIDCTFVFPSLLFMLVFCIVVACS
jgi:hypothetical protein